MASVFYLSFRIAYFHIEIIYDKRRTERVGTSDIASKFYVGGDWFETWV